MKIDFSDKANLANEAKERTYRGGDISERSDENDYKAEINIGLEAELTVLTKQYSIAAIEKA